jgi:spermidine/putrescine transport system permease protein
MKHLDKYLFYGFIGLVFLFIFFPIITIIIFSFNTDKFASLPWRGFTLRWYRNLIYDAGILNSLKNSLIVSTCVAAASCLLGFMGAYTLYRRTFRFQNIFSAFMISPMAIPWIILGLAMLVYLTRIDLEGSLFSVWISHTIFAAPFAMLIIRARLSGLSVRYEEAGWDLGANRLKAIWHIVIPLALPGIIAAFLLTFTLSFDEFIIAWFVCGFQTTLPVKIWALIRSGLNPTINAVGSVIFVFSMTLAIIATLLSGAGRRKRDQEIR